MATYKVNPPFPVITDIDGTPLESGYIYIGTAGLDPETNPISVYFDFAQTLPASQPVRTLNGYPSNSGTPAKLYVAAASYSIRVKNRSGTTVYTSLTENSTSDASFVAYSNANSGLADCTNVQTAIDQIVEISEYNVFNFLSAAQIADVRARTMTLDLTTAVQAAIDAVSTAKGVLRFPAGSYKGNYIIKSDVIIEGDGQEATLFYPFTDAPVFKTPLTVSTVRIGFHRFGIVGDPSFAANDGILLKSTTSATFVDTIDVSEIIIRECGNFGLTAVGDPTNGSGTFVQRLHIQNCTFRDNDNAGISIKGTVLETGIFNTFCVKNGGAAGTLNNAEIISFTGGSPSTTVSPARVAIINCSFNHFLALDAGNTGIALSLQNCTEINIISCDFESADPYIKIANSLARSINIIGNRFGSAYAAASAIEVDDCNGLVIQGNSFQAPTGICAVGILNNTGISRAIQISALDIAKSNVFSGNITTPVSLNYDLEISVGKIYTYLDYLRIDSAGGAGPDDLEYIYDDSGVSGSTDRLVTGQMITLRPRNAARVITIKHAVGNIYTKSSADIVLDDVYKTAVFMWDNLLTAWIEVS